ncbi:hypothetical protein FRB93_005848 [Tulasnella sp. JGI-2019a]|nr:hypothetical protein FRB93_005848 [Tulasnella sp. JGI-2019a]
MPWLNSLDRKESTALWVTIFGSCYVAYKAWHIYQATPRTADSLRGPKPPSWLFGNTQDTRLPYCNRRFEHWMREYGNAFPVHGFFGGRDLLITDTAAIAFILNQPSEFPKTRAIINIARNLVGDGLLSVEGFEHKRQRKVLNPAFSTMAMRDISPMLMHIAHELRDEWKKELLKSKSDDSSFTEIEALGWFSKTALDMIGLAGFGYKFNCIHDSSNELAAAFNNLSKNLSALKGMAMLNSFFPVLRHLPIGSNVANNHNKAIMRRVGLQMVTEKKAEAQKIGQDGSDMGKDLLSLMVGANMTENAAERLDDETLLAEISTFLLAGHETTANALTWGLHELAMAPLVQAKLREEILAFHDDSPSMDELNAMPFLNNVVKEILRLRPSVSNVRRTASSDIVVPLAEPILDKHGKQVNKIFVRHGDNLMVHIFASNTRPDLWGPDASDFRPDRFDDLPEVVSDIPSVFSNLSTFISGPKHCIGWRMAVLEMKVLLFTMIRTFQIDIDPELEITSRFAFGIKPQVKGQEDKGPQMPLRVSLYKA